MEFVSDVFFFMAHMELNLLDFSSALQVTLRPFKKGEFVWISV